MLIIDISLTQGLTTCVILVRVGDLTIAINLHMVYYDFFLKFHLTSVSKLHIV